MWNRSSDMTTFLAWGLASAMSGYAMYEKGDAQCSERLVYEPLSESHGSLLSGALTDPRAYTHITDPHPATAADLAVLFARMAAGPSDGCTDEAWWNFAVRLRSGEFIGRVEATLHDGLAEVAYIFGPNFWNCGYATESVAWLHTQLRENQYANSVWATVLPDNVRSIRLLERLGYRRSLLDQPPLRSYETGDRVYCRSLAT
jgi:RimJ/RimL family protein N-acetyltransferase